MLLQIKEDGSLKNMAVSSYPEMTLFFTSINFPANDDLKDASITVSFRPPQGQERTIDIPLVPETSDLEVLDIDMHKSPTKAHNMGSHYNDWLSDCFGYKVVLAYLGSNVRQVLSTTSNKQQTSGSWLSSMTSMLPTSLGELGNEEQKTITFADCAPFLIVSETSIKDVSKRLPDGEEFDISKFRPNIVVSGADEVWEEDYWAEMTVGGVTIDLIHNCARCKSINIDYATGKAGTGEAGQMLKKLQSDRRVDAGSKYSPIFGRYSFPDNKSDGKSIAVGDEVVITQRNAERSRWGE